MRRAWIYDVDGLENPWSVLGWLKTLLEENEHNHGIKLRVERGSIVLEEVKV